jgi:hypothetical protein
MSEFMAQIHQSLVANNLSDQTASLYIKVLSALNNKKPFTTLAFIKKTDEVMKLLESYAKTTKKTMLAAVISVLKLNQDKTGIKKALKFYQSQFDTLSAELRGGDKPTSEKTEKEESNWVSWEEVKEKYKKLDEEAQKIRQSKKKTEPLSKAEHTTLLQSLILALYTQMPPRRNQDYQLLKYRISEKKKGKWNDTEPLDENFNWLTLDREGKWRFTFNVYKTSKTYGKQTYDVEPNSELSLILHRTINPPPVGSVFLLEQFGKPGEAMPTNGIQRQLSKLFDGRNVGSSMLRHSYLSDKYDVAEMEKDAEQMAHSTGTQRSYLRKEVELTDVVPTPLLTESESPSPSHQA